MDLKGRFCSRPFRHIEIGAKTQETYPCYGCCSSWLSIPLGDMKSQKFQNIWNGIVATAIRNSIHSGSFKFCNHNLCPEITEGRLPYKDEIDDPYLKEIIEKRKVFLDKGPESLNLSSDESCNLECPSCRTEKKMISTGEEFYELRDVHLKILEETFSELGSVSLIGSGDPFASKVSLKILSLLSSSDYPHLKIHFNTNGILLTPERWESLSSIHSNISRIFISIDAASKKTYKKVRKGGDWETLFKNIRHLVQKRKEGSFDHLQLDFVVQNENYREMKPFVELGYELGVDSIGFNKIINWGTFSDQEFQQHAVWKKSHPNHAHFLQHLEDPIFDTSFVKLGNCTPYRS